MPGKNRAHYRGSYARQAKAVRDAANADPSTRCWRCGLTLREHAPHKNGKPPTWDAGHVNDGQAGGVLAAEASTCNRQAGATEGHRRQRMTLTTTRRW